MVAKNRVTVGEIDGVKFGDVASERGSALPSPPALDTCRA